MAVAKQRVREDAPAAPAAQRGAAAAGTVASRDGGDISGSGEGQSSVDWQEAASNYHVAAEIFMRARNRGLSDDERPAAAAEAPGGSGSADGNGSGGV